MSSVGHLGAINSRETRPRSRKPSVNANSNSELQPSAQTAPARARRIPITPSPPTSSVPFPGSFPYPPPLRDPPFGRIPLYLQGREVQGRSGPVIRSSTNIANLPVNDTQPWSSQRFQPPPEAHFSGRRSQSQPDVQLDQSHLGSQQQDVEMSSFTQILPSPSSHFGPGQDFFSSAVYPPYSGYGNMSSYPNQPYLNVMADQRPSTITSSFLPTSPPYGQSAARSSRPPSHSPPSRTRTPIRHHRAGVTRTRSGSRPDVLLAYATEQQQQHQQQQSQQQQAQQQDAQQQPRRVLSSQPVTSSPPQYPPSAYMMPVTSAPPMSGQSSYYEAPPGGPSGTQYLAAPPSYTNDTSQQPYFGMARSMSHPAPLDLPTLNPQDALYLPNPVPSNSPPLPSLGSSLQSYPSSNSLESSPEGFRILASRPKPQCFDHGCNGRQFSTFSNLLRHQREKSGSAMKAVCPHCGTEFTRTTARNGHLWGGKCKGRSGEEAGTSGQSAPSTTGSE